MLLQIGLPGGPEIILFNLVVAAVVAYFTNRQPYLFERGRRDVAAPSF